jgi:hypothetical protein
MSHARTHLVLIAAGALAASAVLGTVAVAAGASGGTTSGNGAPDSVPATLAGIKAKATTDITDRVNDLNSAIGKVNGATGLGSSQGTLDAYLGTDISPLQQLNQTIQGDSTVSQAAQDFSTIFADYRVYVLVLPASRIAAGADHATTTAIPALSADASKAQGLVNPQNQAQLEPLIDDLNAQISTASNATNGLAATVLAFTPAQWNADHDLLATATSSEQTADGALQKGRADVQQIRQLLKGADDGTADAARATTTTS